MCGIHAGTLGQVVEHLTGGFLFGILLSGTLGTAYKFWRVAVGSAEMCFHRELFFVFRALFPN